MATTPLFMATGETYTGVFATSNITLFTVSKDGFITGALLTLNGLASNNVGTFDTHSMLIDDNNVISFFTDYDVIPLKQTNNIITTPVDSNGNMFIPVKAGDTIKIGGFSTIKSTGGTSQLTTGSAFISVSIMYP